MPASPAQFQFSHARDSPARQGFHLRAPPHISQAGCQQLTFAPRTPAAKAPSPTAIREPGRPDARRQSQGGAAAPGVRGTAVATPTGCEVTAPTTEAGGADRCSRPFCPAPAGPGSQTSAPDRPRPPPRAPPVRPPCPAPDDGPAEAVRGPGGDECFTGGWAPRRRCRCSRSPARSVHAPGQCPDPRCSPPSWLEAEEPARRGAAQKAGASGARTAGTSGTPREREWAGRRAGASGARTGGASQPWVLALAPAKDQGAT